MKKSALLLISFFVLIYSPRPIAAASYFNTIHTLENNPDLLIIVSILLIGIMLFLFRRLALTNRELIISQNKIQNFNKLLKTFIDADDKLVFLKDDQFKYVFVNRAFELFLQKESGHIIGRDDFDLLDEISAGMHRDKDMAVIKQQSMVVDELFWKGRQYKSTKFPVELLNGSIGVGAYIEDITEEQENKKKQKKMLQRHMIITDVFNRSFKNTQEQLDYALHEALKLTESRFGYIYLYNEDRREFTLNSWTAGVMKECTVADKKTIYQLDKTGIWGDVVRYRKPLLINDFQQPMEAKKGYPSGHVQLKKYMSIPVFIDDEIVAVIGMANKISDYDDTDLYEMNLLMSGVWNAIQRREIQDKLSFERNKYLQTLISIGDGVLVVDINGNIEMLNNVSENLTGWPAAEAIGRHYKEVFQLSGENGRIVEDPIEAVFKTNNIQKLGNHAILTSRRGLKFNLEDSAAPIRNDQGQTVGVVLVFRDITEKKEQRELIEYLSFHDSLTGLYNMRFFEEELRRLDTERNLPISIIMGDVNGLKLTNDIFGHFYGDILLQKLAVVLRKTCRADDIIARRGGDEFVLLLPKTDFSEAEQIIQRIKLEFMKQQVKAVKGSVSMGAGTKNHPHESIKEILSRAEDEMYTRKTLECDAFKTDIIESIIGLLHKNSAREKEHSINVSRLSEQMGKVLGLEEKELKKLKEAGYYHDIGKVVLEPKLLNKRISMDEQEWNEIKKHPILGYRILNSFDQTLDLAEIVLAHQERWDGTGYPKGLKEEEIPLLSRVIALAESYERRRYGTENNAPVCKADALSDLRQNAGRHFDPLLTEVFVNMLEVDAHE